MAMMMMMMMMMPCRCTAVTRLRRKANASAPTLDEAVKNCYNSHTGAKADEEYGFETVCTIAEKELKTAYAGFTEFNKACVGKLGAPCTSECRSLAGLYDTAAFSGYSSDNEKNDGPVMRVEVGNKILRRPYTMKLTDCLRCLMVGECSLPPDTYT